MAKSIKRVVMIFFVLVISCLLIFGCINTFNIVDDSSKTMNTNAGNNITTNENSDIYYSNNITQNKDLANYNIPTTDNVFELKGNCDEMAEGWSNAINESLKTGNVVKMILMNDWIAKDDENHTFGTGVGFSTYGFMTVPHGSNVILDLKGHKIDKHFTSIVADKNLPVFYIQDNFTLMDSEFDYEQAKNIYNQYKANKDTLIAKLKELKCGKIMGGATVGNGGAINTAMDAKYSFTINIYGGMLLENFANCGGGINIYQNVTLNIYDGIILNNISNGNSAGGICVYGTLNMYGGIVAGNSSIRYGGGIFTSLGTVNLYDGIITHNTTGQDGAGVYVNGTVVSEVVQASGYLNMYGGIISYNRSSQYGGGIDFRTGGQGKIYGGEISHNWTFNDSGGILVWTYCKLEIFGGKITENEAHGANTGNSNCGAGILVGDNSTVIMNDGEITNNHMYSDINVLSTGGGIHVEGASQLILNGGVIAGNTAESTAGANGGGVYNDAGSYVYLGGGIKIYNNTANGRDSDLFLKNKVKLIIQKKLFTKEEMAHIGIDLATDYSDTTFTLDFGGSGNSLANATLLFFSNKANEVPTLKSGEVAFVSGTKATANVTWSWQGDSSGSVNNKMTDIAVTYTGNPYTIKMQNNNFYKVGDAATASSFTAVLAGKYTFYTKENYLNPVFTFTILPKEVDIVWQHTDLIYNGVLQKPTAYIAEDSNCNVITIGEKINSGSGYVATAIGLSNSNYKIKNNSSSIFFNIAKAKLNRPTGSGNFEYDGGQKEFTPNGYNYVTMNIVGNTATNTGDYTATISIKDKHNYEWVDGGTEDIVLPYSITLTPPIDQYNGVYKFMYIDTEDGKEIRKTYAQGGIVHGINDKTLNGGVLVLGGISPNTSIKTFLDTLGFDKTKVTLMDNKGNDVFKNNAPVDASNYDNGKEYAVGTGWRVIYNNNGNTEEIYLSVLGDINGDGRISASDVATLREIANNKAVYENLSVEIKLASIVINKGNVTTADSEIVKNVIDRLFDINIFF